MALLAPASQAQEKARHKLLRAAPLTAAAGPKHVGLVVRSTMLLFCCFLGEDFYPPTLVPAPTFATSRCAACLQQAVELQQTF